MAGKKNQGLVWGRNTSIHSKRCTRKGINASKITRRPKVKEAQKVKALRKLKAALRIKTRHNWENSPLLRAPKELREIIWGYVAQQDGPVLIEQRPFSDHKQGVFDTSVLAAVCKTTRLEATEVSYRINKFRVLMPSLTKSNLDRASSKTDLKEFFTPESAIDDEKAKVKRNFEPNIKVVFGATMRKLEAEKAERLAQEQERLAREQEAREHLAKCVAAGYDPDKFRMKK